MITQVVTGTRVAGTALVVSRDEYQPPDWQSGNVEIASRRMRFVAVGLPPMPVGAEATIDGYLECHPLHGDQIHVEVCKAVALPRTIEGVALFLGGGNIPDIGPARAAQIVQRLGLTSIQQIEARPTILAEIFPDLHGQRMVEGWLEWQRRSADARAEADVSSRLLSLGVGKADTRRIVAHFRAADVVGCVLGRHPYRLLDVPGVGWRRADAIARTLGVESGDPRRLTAATAHVLAERQRAGHSCFPLERLSAEAARLLRTDSADPALAESEGLIVIEDGRAYLPNALEAEYAITHRLARHMRVSHSVTEAVLSIIGEECARSMLSAKQAEAVVASMRYGVSILTGGPGTGKTTTIRTIAQVAKRLGQSYVLIAPTGKAASRAAEVTGGQAGTIHRILRTPPGHHAPSPLVSDLVILDEASMVSAEILAWLLANLRPETRLLILGDTAQLPSIEHGAVLRDLIASGRIPTTHLTEPRRQGAGSGIVANAERVLRGEPLVDTADCWVNQISVATGSDALPRENVAVLNQLTSAIRALASQGLDIRADVQILTPRRKGPLGVGGLNRVLQRVFNPAGDPGPSIGAGYVVRTGDRVTQMRNDYTLGTTGVFNGEQGIVTAVLPGEARVRFDQREVTVSGVQLYNLQLAWASTIHRSQGSEWPHVVSIFHRSHMMNVHTASDHDPFVTSALLYTAMTRAKTTHGLIADGHALETMRLSAGDPVPRFTGLAERLRDHLR